MSSARRSRRLAFCLALATIQPRTVHPLLIYGELLVTGGEREGEAAAEIRERYLRELR